LDVNYVLPAGNDISTPVPLLSHKQITHWLRIAFMGIACPVRSARAVTCNSGRLQLAKRAPAASMGSAREFFWRLPLLRRPVMATSIGASARRLSIMGARPARRRKIWSVLALPYRSGLLSKNAGRLGPTIKCAVARAGGR